MVSFVADSQHEEFTPQFPTLTDVRISLEEFDELHVAYKNVVKKNEHITMAAFETENDAQLSVEST